jgi:hypothetical protein
MTAISPHEMYLQICGDNYHNSYMEMKTKMRFYDKRENADKYRIPCLLLFDGFLCAAKYPQMCNEWHRSRIISIDKQNNVTLELIDIGISLVFNSNRLNLIFSPNAKFLKSKQVFNASDSHKKLSNPLLFRFCVLSNF